MNTGNVQYTNVSISFTVTDQNNNTVAVHSDDSNPNLPRFNIMPNSPTTKYGKDVVNQNAIIFNSSFKNIERIQIVFSEGNYELCVSLIDQNGKEIATTGMKCADFTVVIPDPPTLFLNPPKRKTLH